MGCYGNGTSNEWPYGQWRQVAAATVGGTMFRVVPFNHTGYTSHVAMITCAGERYHSIYGVLSFCPWFRVG